MCRVFSLRELFHLSVVCNKNWVDRINFKMMNYIWNLLLNMMTQTVKTCVVHFDIKYLSMLKWREKVIYNFFKSAFFIHLFFKLFLLRLQQFFPHVVDCRSLKCNIDNDYYFNGDSRRWFSSCNRSQYGWYGCRSQVSFNE